MQNNGTPFQVKTAKPVKEGAIPREPHERDESPDSQESGKRDVIRQAYTDVTNGQVDTDLRGGSSGVEEVVQANSKEAEKASEHQPAVVRKTKEGRT